MVTTLVAALLRRWQLCGAAIAVTILKLVGERVVKMVVERNRPGTTVEEAVLRGDVPATGQSFVSGHAVLVAGLAVVVTRHLPPRWRPVPWVLVGLVMIARVYVGAHNPLDVIGGVGLGLALGGIVNLAQDVWSNRREGDAGEAVRAAA